jgi:hypothetical protein
MLGRRSCPPLAEGNTNIVSDQGIAGRSKSTAQIEPVSLPRIGKNRVSAGLAIGLPVDVFNWIRSPRRLDPEGLGNVRT